MEQPVNQFDSTSKNNLPLLPVAVAVILTAIIVGGGIYWWTSQKQTELNNEIISLRTQVDQLKQVSTPPTQIPVAEADVAILYPNGGENLSVNQSVTINYKISDNFRKKISADTLVEIYLLRTDGVLEGYIGGITDYSKTSFVWDPQKLQHWGGLDTTSRAPKAGQYKVLISARSKTPPPTHGGDYPVDIFVDGYDKFDGHQILVIRDGNTLSQRELISNDVSDSSFGLK